jgi:hypothetical protein
MRGTQNNHYQGIGKQNLNRKGKYPYFHLYRSYNVLYLTLNS